MSVHGGEGVVFLLSQGKLQGFGDNSRFLLGQGSRTNLSQGAEIKIPGTPEILHFQNGLRSDLTVVLTTKGLYACGQVGTASTMFGEGSGSSSRMLRLEFYRNKNVEKYFVEGHGLWVILKDETIFRSGDNYEGALGNGTRNDIMVPEKLDKSFLTSKKEMVVDIKAFFHSFLLTDSGIVYGCGSGKQGCRGDTNNLDDVVYLVHTVFEKNEFFPKEKEKVVQIAVGWRHSLFATMNDKVYSCGSGDFGETGLNHTNETYIPARIEILKGEKIKKIHCGEEFSLVHTHQNVVWAFGRGEYYQTLLETKQNILVPTQVQTKLRVFEIATTFKSTTLLTSNGEVYSAGKNDCCQCGIGTSKGPVKSLTRSKIQIIVLENALNTLFTGYGQPRKLTDCTIIVMS